MTSCGGVLMHQWTRTVPDTGHKYSVLSGIVSQRVGILEQEMVQSYSGQMELETLGIPGMCWVTELKSNNYQIKILNRRIHMWVPGA